MFVGLWLLLCTFVNVSVTDTVLVTPVGNVLMLGVPVLIVVGEVVIDTDLVISVDIDGEALIVGVLEFVVLELSVAVCRIVFVVFVVRLILVEADLVLEA